MKKKFNITGVCYPSMHYMMDTSQKMKEIMAMLEEREQVLETIDKIDAIVAGVRAEARFLRGLIVVSAIILLGGFVGLWVAA